MFRSIHQYLVQWKNSPLRKPLILRGARQVGKTYSVKQFGQEYFPDQCVILDLEKRSDLHALFELNLEPQG